MEDLELEKIYELLGFADTLLSRKMKQCEEKDKKELLKSVQMAVNEAISYVEEIEDPFACD